MQCRFLENIRGLSGFNGKLDSVVDLDVRVGVSEGASIVRDGARNLVSTNIDLVDSAKLVLGFLSGEAAQDVSSLDVVKETVTVVGLGHLDDVHAGGQGPAELAPQLIERALDAREDAGRVAHDQPTVAHLDGGRIVPDVPRRGGAQHLRLGRQAAPHERRLPGQADHG